MAIDLPGDDDATTRGKDTNSKDAKSKGRGREVGSYSRAALDASLRDMTTSLRLISSTRSDGLLLVAALRGQEGGGHPDAAPKPRPG